MTCNVILLPEYLCIFLFESIVMAILILFSNLNTFFRTTIALILFFYLLYMLLYISTVSNLFHCVLTWTLNSLLQLNMQCFALLIFKLLTTSRLSGCFASHAIINKQFLVLLLSFTFHPISHHWHWRVDISS